METTKPIDALRSLVVSGEYHHATYRCEGTLWEGLWFYRRASDGFRGYEVAGCVPKGDPDLDAAYRVIPDGVHVGSYGNG